MSKSALVIVNPTARRGEAVRYSDTAQDVLIAQGWDVDLCMTRSAEHATQLAAHASSDDILVAVGGDGLHARVAAGAMQSGASMAPLPAGRGHDFIRALGASSDIRTAAEALVTAQERRIDVGLVGGVPFLGVATLGIDSRANAIANQAPRAVPSGFVYVYGGSRALWETRPEPFIVKIDDETIEFHGWNIAIGNSGRYGGGMKVNPDASMDDGLLDVTIFRDLRRWQYPMNLPKLFRGTHIDGRYVCAYRGATVEVVAPTSGDVYVDGDRLENREMGSLTFTVAPRALRVLAGRAQG